MGTSSWLNYGTNPLPCHHLRLSFTQNFTNVEISAEINCIRRSIEVTYFKKVINDMRMTLCCGSPPVTVSNIDMLIDVDTKFHTCRIKDTTSVINKPTLLIALHKGTQISIPEP